MKQFIYRKEYIQIILASQFKKYTTNHTFAALFMHSHSTVFVLAVFTVLSFMFITILTLLKSLLKT